MPHPNEKADHVHEHVPDHGHLNVDVDVVVHVLVDGCCFVRGSKFHNPGAECPVLGSSIRDNQMPKLQTSTWTLTLSRSESAVAVCSRVASRNHGTDARYLEG
jgi:hypothetical protein